MKPFSVVISCLMALAVTVTTHETVRPTSAATDDPVVVFLVRHAEKAADLGDPDLTDEGRARADALARMLGDAGIEHVYSTDYRRTRATAAPLAAALRLEVDTYDSRQLATFAASMQRGSGRHLVVGHSNTTPELVTLLGGTAGEPIDEATEYDRLYVLTIDGVQVSTVLLRYGEHHSPAAAPE